MYIWQVQEAKAKLTEFINEAKSAPQFISRRGKPEVVAISIEKYNELTGMNKNIVSFFRSSPLYDSDIVLERDQSETRDADL